VNHDYNCDTVVNSFFCMFVKVCLSFVLSLYSDRKAQYALRVPLVVVSSKVLLVSCIADCIVTDS
jgi:hypothetical protein